MTPLVTIRAATPADAGAIWDILQPVIDAGQTYPLPRDMDRDAALAYWLSPVHQVFVAILDGQIAGTYYLRPNNLGGGAHIANCGYISAKKFRGKGVARAMCAHSLNQAKADGFKAMQFNFVIASNKTAVGLWTSMGFETLCQLPKVFDHPKEGLVDALVMFKELD
ncbi:hypothetical protein MNBD_ALPHA12-464 [hydrothermal vent metagenome]|uniref:N-acetyltransferase domain-containing protein n=1 Tax=hydrothermal vent metagenome TaxID=652676 RepID=A0A3B0THB3_9ZZZZ